MPRAHTGGAGPSGNRALAAALSGWAFQETRVLRATSPRHGRAGGGPPEALLSSTPRSDLPAAACVRARLPLFIPRSPLPPPLVCV